MNENCLKRWFQGLERRAAGCDLLIANSFLKIILLPYLKGLLLRSELEDRIHIAPLPLLSNTCICILRSSSRVALLAGYVFSSTITRRAVTLPAAGMSERLPADFTRWRDMKRFGAESLGSGVALFAAFVARLQSSRGCD